jgi:hypothetical protein
VTQIDVRATLANTPRAVSENVFGAVPLHPMAMAWHFIERALYVLDAIQVGNRRALRLLRVATSGNSVELWRTRDDDELPRARLSVDNRGDIIVSLADGDSTEFVAMGRMGGPDVSQRVAGQLSSAVVGSMGGFSIPLSRRPHSTTSNLDVAFVSRRETAPGLCGAPWLRDHADVSCSNPLGDAARQCGEGPWEGDGDGRH